ncbi:MAG TPA: DUF3306 domain-containing protein [Bosea sp. (in: a-proteobacteria)]|jgi:hypothetical protein|uniref:DUF3306 domain-containing protein n=1 Tax=Bosea sp. (in: a-proteobacteria) TaxID=1871050 RepID=UPI002E14D5AA|nr:DUF3306 domain-containing protein [Bosea sp. (in: a-proteobacteria)]
MSAGAPEEEGFLSRWSRRKREQAEPEATRAATPAEMSAPAEAGLSPTVPAESEPEIEPPALDLVDKDFDLAPWLKRNVPESWKLAALRRAWESDPAIAGFENPARDYALDWNTPGGAPGYGPLTESDDVAGMLRSIFGEKPEPEATVLTAAEREGDGMSHPLSSNDEGVKTDAATRDASAGGEGAKAVRLSSDAAEVQDLALLPQQSGSSVYAAVQNTAPEKAPSMRLRKRGGGAIPT